MKRIRAKHRKSGIKGLALTLAAAMVLASYPVGVIWTFLANDKVEASVWSRLWYALGWPLLTFLSLMDEARKHMPRPMA